MSSLKEAFRHGLGPYNAKITLTVVGACPDRTYSKDGEDRHLKVAAVWDGEDMARLHCYDKPKFSRLQMGNVVSLINTITKIENNTYVISATRNSKIFSGRTVVVSPDVKAAAELLLNPPAAAVVPISVALASPPRTKVSVKGKITQEGEPQTVKVKGEDVPIKSIQVKDRSGNAKVTLWRDACHTDIRPGDFVTTTDVIPNQWKNETSLSTTSRTTMTKCEAPTKNETGEVVGISNDDTTVDFLLEDDRVITVDKGIVLEALSAAEQNNTEIEDLTNNGPVTVCYTLQNEDVVALRIQE